MVPHWQTPYLGIRTLPRLSAWEIDTFFTLDPTKRDDICCRFRGLNRLAVALQLSFLRMTGCPLDGVRILPAELLSHLGAQLAIDTPTIASVRALYRRKRTRYDHQQWAMTRLDFASLTPGRRRVLVTRLRQQARTTGDVNSLVAYARRWLFDQHIIIPGQRALKELSARLLVEVERTLYLEVLEAIPERACEQWLQALYEEQPVYQIQLIDWLKTPPAKRSQSHLKELFARIAALKALKVHQYALPFPLERQRFYATRMRRRFPQRFRAMSPTRRTLELTCFLRVTLMDLVDTVLLQVEKRITELWSSARQTAERRRNERTVEDWTAVEAIHRALYDSTMSDRQARLAARAIIDPLIERKPPPRAVLTREALLQEPGIRSLLRALMALDFVAAPDHPGGLALMQLRSLYASGERELPADIGMLVPLRWQPLIDDPDRRRAFCAFEAATLYTLRLGLKNGSIAVEYSFSYRSPLVSEKKSILMPLDEWEKNKGKYYKALGLPRSPEKFLAKLTA